MPSESVKVMVRVRPMNQREREKASSQVVEVDEEAMQVTLTNPADGDTQKVFSYDGVFGQNSLQQTIYERSAFHLVESVLEGYNGTIFAYGQTGCGKTHTMVGNPTDEVLRGIIPRAFAHIFGNIESTQNKQFLIRCSYIEIYNEEIHDLLGADVKARLELKEGNDKGVFIKGLTMHTVKSIPEIERLMLLGSKNRSVGETAMNKDSSRSHSIFTIYIEASDDDRITAGKLNLVDLAGSERQSKTQATGDRLKEANKINLSLSALGNVISALVDGKSSHVPYRDSKLTRLLQDSLGGNTKTVMIANVSPASENYDETLGTLRYASRAKSIKNQPKINEDPKDALLREYADEIRRLKEMLERGEGVPSQEGGDAEMQPRGPRKNKENDLKQKEAILEEERRKREELERKLQDMQKNLLQGGQAPGRQGQEDGETDEKKNYQEMLEKLKNDYEQQEALIEEKRRRQEEVLIAEKKYNNLQEEIDDLKKVLKKLRKKYKDTAADIEDLQHEHNERAEELLETIRILEKDVRINVQIIQQILAPEEIEKVRKKVRWIEERNEFLSAPFVVRQKKVKFPKVPFGQGMVMVKEDWKNRELEILEDENEPQAQKETMIEDFWANRTDIRKRTDNTQSTKYSSKDGTIASVTPLGKKSTLLSKASLETINPLQDRQNYNRIDMGNQWSAQRKAPRGVHLEPLNKPSAKELPSLRETIENNSGIARPKGQIGPLKPLGNMNERGNNINNNNNRMKLQFKATVLINNGNPELANMDFQ